MSSYLNTATAPDDLEGLMEYIRPRTADEFSAELAQPMSVPEPPPRLELTDLGLSPEEFAELALQAPDLWDEEELDQLYQRASGEDVDVDDLMTSYLTRTKKRPDPVVLQPPKDEPEADEGLPDTLALPPPAAVSTEQIPDLDELKDLADVTDWYVKKK